MYRKGLSSRANKVSSLVASTDNNSSGFKGQDSVPNAGAHGIRKNVFRILPKFPPSKNRSRFSKMNLMPRPYPFEDKTELIKALTLIAGNHYDKDTAYKTYGDISTWNVTKVTDMSSLFSDITLQNLDSEITGINSWDVSNVTNMSSMFQNSKFNGNLSNWDVSNVERMDSMFQNAHFDNNSILSWNFRNDGTFIAMNMFNGSLASNIDFRSLNLTPRDDPNVQQVDTHHVPYMFTGSIFYSNSSADFKENLLNRGTPGNPEPGNPEISFFMKFPYKPLSLSELKLAVNLWVDDNTKALLYYQNISDWDISSITSLNNLFNHQLTGNSAALQSFNSDITTWNVSNVTDFANVFANTTIFNQDINSWNLSNATTTKNMFGDSVFDRDISSWNLSNVTEMTGMFRGSQFNQNISSWNVTKVTDMTNMFLNNTVFNQNIRNWNVSSSTVTTNIFNNATAMNTLYSDFINASGITDTFFRSIFTFNNNNIKQALTDYTTDTTNGSLKYGSISTWELHNVTSMSQLFTFVSGSYEINYNNIAGIGSWNISNVIDMTNMFSQVNANRPKITSTQLDTIVAQIKSWDVSNVTTMKKMFFNNENFNDVHVIPLRTWNVTSDTILTDIFTQTAAKSKSPVSDNLPITHNFFNQPETPPVQAV